MRAPGGHAAMTCTTTMRRSSAREDEATSGKSQEKAMRVGFREVAVVIMASATATALFLGSLEHSKAQTNGRYLPEYTASGDLVLPKNFNEWVYVGSPLTPIALNGGKACPEPASDSSGPCTGFPEYHNVYIEPGSYEIYKQTKQFPEGTILFKELQLTLPAQFPD